MSRRDEEIKTFKQNFLKIANEIKANLENIYGKDFWRIKEIDKLIEEWNQGIISDPAIISRIGAHDDDIEEKHPEIDEKLYYILEWIRRRAYWNSLGLKHLL